MIVETKEEEKEAALPDNYKELLEEDFANNVYDNIQKQFMDKLYDYGLKNYAQNKELVLQGHSLAKCFNALKYYI